jgi:hypothetical protein
LSLQTTKILLCSDPHSGNVSQFGSCEINQNQSLKQGWTQIILIVTVNLKYYLIPCPAFLPSQEGSADNQFKWDTACTEGEGEGGGLDNLLMSIATDENYAVFVFYLVNNGNDVTVNFCGNDAYLCN